ncbi:MAG: hypothetical protein DRR19_12400 [Candidatus Parabeggiatoa sp. nov. 1]|nr:MAG: hypothetical protein DRR19_12400 [Gammaproteobacteria bacterium]
MIRNWVFCISVISYQLSVIKKSEKSVNQLYLLSVVGGRQRLLVAHQTLLPAPKYVTPSVRSPPNVVAGPKICHTIGGGQ